MNNPYKYILYARKSSEAKERQVASIGDQIAECEKVSKQNNIKIGKVYKESKSAYKPNNRPVFDEIVELIKAGKIEAILTWKEDRICRNPEEGGKIMQLLQDGKLKEIRTPNAIYTQDSDHLILQIHFGMANQFSRNLSQNVRRGLNYKAKRGEYPRPAPIGYEGYGLARQRKIRPHPTEGPLIKKMFEICATGNYSLKQLRTFLKSNGLTTKKGKGLSISHIHRMLNHTVYYGYFTHNGELYEGVYEPLISKSLFDQAQEGLKNRSKPRKHIWEGQRELNGLITCAECGCAITTTVKKKYYKGTDRTALYSYCNCTKKKKACSQKPVKKNDVKVQIVNDLNTIGIDKETWQLAMELAKAKYEQEINEYGKLKRNYSKKVLGIEDKLKRLLTMRMDNELTKEEFLAEKNILTDEKIKLEEIINSDSSELGLHWLERTKKFFDIALESGEIKIDTEKEKIRNVVQTLGKNLYLKDGNIDIQLKQPYDILRVESYHTNVQDRRDSNPHELFWRQSCYH